MVAWVVNSRLHQRAMRPRPPIYQPLGSIGLAPARLSNSLPFLSFQSLTNCPRFATLFQPLSFQPTTNCPICKSFVLITIQQCRGWVGGQQGGGMKVIPELRRRGIHRNQVVSLRTFQHRQRHSSLQVSVHSAPLRYLFLRLPPTFKRFPRIPFRINTCRTASKQTTLSTFRINTYEKTRGGVLSWLTKFPTRRFALSERRESDLFSHSKKSVYPEGAPPAAVSVTRHSSLATTPVPPTSHESPITSHGITPMGLQCWRTYLPAR